MNDFFNNCSELDRMVLKPLSHIHLNWELTWDPINNKYKPKENSFAEDLNELIKEINNTNPPVKYHDNEDVLAEYVKEHLNWSIRKEGNRWICEDYIGLLEQGGFGDINEVNLVYAATGRIHAAIRFGQNNFDDMEDGHKKILSYVLAIILYHRKEF